MQASQLAIIIGSNISNILLILGVVASTGPLNVSAEIANRDVWVMLGVAILGLVLTLSRHVQVFLGLDCRSKLIMGRDCSKR